MIASVTSVLLNFISIFVLNLIFTSIAEYLTNLEIPKTHEEYEKSYTLKMFLFQAVNFWSSIFYIAFIKGRGTGTPISYTRFGETGSIRLEECHPAGCLFDLSLQLAIIMILKQENVKIISLRLIGLF
jgi:hypothetical protein